ncbi:uncharacterized protein LOC121370296 [Gigantopelta aegis]|uniref:uncharacterized protein LOC121370296 n=1 Tax=Gigantopelta aegis TaxID=1735272 RepID=UPI001B88B510|nr:uncharacterized protein LOC121370296 [Gigantopelta aegis]
MEAQTSMEYGRTAKRQRLEYGCSDCGQTFAHKQSLNRHKKTAHGSPKLTCSQCKMTFTRRDNLHRHLKTHLQQGGANESTPRGTSATEPTPTQQEPVEPPCDLQALGGTMQVHTIPGEGIQKYDPMTFLKGKYDEVKKVLKQAIKDRGELKWYLTIKVKMSRRKGEVVETVEPHFRGKCQTSLKFEDPDEGMKESIKKIYTSFIEFQRQGSNWTVDKVVDLTIHMARYRPLRGSSYTPLPIKLRAKHAIVNVQNRDQKCFMWSVLAALYPVKQHAERVAKYAQYVNQLDTTGISFPVKLVDIPRFERQNNISINVFGYEKGDVYPLHVTKQRFERHVDLLMIANSKKSHFCWIKDLNRLLFDQKSYGHRHHYCPYCLQGFTKQRILDDHLVYCQTHGPQKVDMPKDEDKWLYYKNVRKQLKVPYIVYADFECLQVPISRCEKSPESSSTEKMTKHVPSGFAYKVVGLSPEHCKPLVTYRGLDATDKFVECMVKEQEDIEEKFKQCELMVMTGRDWQSFKTATQCHICKAPLGPNPVRDHCHITGEFRGATHSECNLNYKFTGRIPVVFHNLRGYDSHLIMQAIGKIQSKPISCIPNNMEKYISFSLGCMDFIDSFQFMNFSLEKLVSNLAKEGPSKFVHMTQHFGADQLPLLLRKQVYPYEYFDSEARFLETQLPPKEAFRSSLTDEDISDEDYAHAQGVWEEFRIRDLGQYHDLYVSTDVLALADVFENFRGICLNYYGLDPAHFYTSPGLAWQAALKMTGVKLELLTDIDMHLFIEKGLRGGISMISHRHAKANNNQVPNHDPDLPNTYIAYLDANNLYGWAMSQALPVSGFQWLDDPHIDVTEVPDDASVGYILEVDLDYPQELHDLHNEYPLAPEKMTVTEDMLSPYASQLLKELDMSGISTEKLIPNLRQKERYVVHYRNLKLYISLGMKLTKIHRVLAFEQSPWLKAYIDFNTNRRKCAQNDFEKEFFKLMNNSVFGKTMENLRKHVDVKLVNNSKRARKFIAKPTFHAFRIFNKDLVAIHMQKQRLILNRPIYVGFAILDISKILMYDFHYNYIKSKYASKAQLLFTDTDSLCYYIQTDDIYQDMLQDSNLFDTSEYPTDHVLYSTVNKKVLGKMKDETHGIPIQEFVGLKSKMYSLIFEEKGELVEKKTAKGIKKSVIKSHTKHEHYKQCLFERRIHMSNMTQIRSYSHQLYNIKLNKLGLSPFDDKRYLLSDGISSLAYGHYHISA